MPLCAGRDLLIKLEVTNINDDVAGIQFQWLSQYAAPEPKPVVKLPTLTVDTSRDPASTTTLNPNGHAMPANAPSLSQFKPLPTYYCEENSTTAVWFTARLTSEPYGPVTIAIDVVSTAGASSVDRSLTQGPNVTPACRAKVEW